MNSKAWSVLSNRKFFILWVSQAISRLGDSLFYIALLWYVQESTGSSLMLGFTGAAMMAPAVLGLVAGVMVDRWDRLKVMLVSDVARGLLISLIVLLAYLNLLQFWHLLLVILLSMAIAEFFYPALYAVIPQLVSKDELRTANSLFELPQNVLRLSGYAIAGFLVASLGIVKLFAFDAFSFFVSGLAILALLLTRANPKGREANFNLKKQTLLEMYRDIVYALAIFRETPMIRTLLPVLISINFAAAPLTVLLPKWSSEVLKVGAQGFGVMNTAQLAGALVGNIALASVSIPLSAKTTVAAGLLFIGIQLAVFASIPVYAVSYITILLQAVAGSIINIVLVSELQKTLPNEILGKAFGALAGIIQLATPLGMLLAGWLAEILPISYAFLFTGLSCIFGGIYVFGARSWEGREEKGIVKT